jgi:uncharacterized protein (TIGR01655 family)
MKARKKTKMVVILIAVAVLIIALAIVGRQYYQDRYVSSDYYTMVPLDYDVTPEPKYSDNGELMGQGKEYVLTVYSTDGESREVSFNVYAPGSGLASERELPKPGEYLLVKASKTIVTNWNVVDKSQVPDEILAKIG